MVEEISPQFIITTADCSRRRIQKEKKRVAWETSPFVPGSNSNFSRGLMTFLLSRFRKAMLLEVKCQEKE
jgi:hypothetical protein